VVMEIPLEQILPDHLTDQPRREIVQRDVERLLQWLRRVIIRIGIIPQLPEILTRQFLDELKLPPVDVRAPATRLHAVNARPAEEDVLYGIEPRVVVGDEIGQTLSRERANQRDQAVRITAIVIDRHRDMKVGQYAVTAQHRQE